MGEHFDNIYENYWGYRILSWYLVKIPTEYSITPTIFINIIKMFSRKIDKSIIDENLSIVSEALVSCADEKLVTGLHGNPSALIFK